MHINQDKASMLSLTRMAAALGLSASLCACVAPAQRDTYDAIKAQVATASATTNAATQSDAVEAALLPPVAALAGQLPKARAVLDERFNVAFNNVPARQFLQFDRHRHPLQHPGAP